MKVQSLHSHFQAIEPPKEGFDPRAYHVIGSGFKRGDARRTMSRGELVEFSRNAARWVRGYNEEKESAAMEWGSLLDCLITQPGKFDELYAVAPREYPGTPKRKGDPVEMKPWRWGSTFTDSWAADQSKAGKEIATAPQAEKAFAAEERLQEDKILWNFIARSRKQVFVLVEYLDEDTRLSIPIKCLMDFAPLPDDEEYGNTLGDLKTTNDANPRKWIRTVSDYKWHWQAAMYLDAMNAAADTNYTQFAHVVQESVKPYETARRMLSEEFIQIGRAEYKRALADYCWCVKNQKFPGYDDIESMRGSIRDGWRVVEPEAWMIGEQP